MLKFFFSYGLVQYNNDTYSCVLSKHMELQKFFKWIENWWYEQIFLIHLKFS